MSDPSHHGHHNVRYPHMSTSNHAVKALLFDVDGTMADTDIFHRQVFKEILKPFGIDCDDEYYNSKISGQSNRNLHQLLVPHLSHDEAVQLFVDKESAFRYASKQHLKPLKGLIQFMQKCRSRGILIAAVTNAPKPNVEMMLELFGLATHGQAIGASGVNGPNGRLDTVVLGDDCTHSKPHPEAYQVAMKRLGVHPNECFVFEDSASGVKAGVAAGCKVVGVTTTKSESEMKELGCVAAIDDYTQIDIDAFLDTMDNFIIKPQHT